MTVCALYATRQAPPAGSVQVTARVVMDPRHGAVLVDPHCPPGTAIGMRFTDPLPAHSQAEAFDHALTGNPMDLSLRSFEAEVSGTYTAASEANPRGLFVVDHVAWFRKQPPHR